MKRKEGKGRTREWFFPTLPACSRTHVPAATKAISPLSSVPVHLFKCFILRSNASTTSPSPRGGNAKANRHINGVSHSGCMSHMRRCTNKGAPRALKKNARYTTLRNRCVEARARQLQSTIVDGFIGSTSRLGPDFGWGSSATFLVVFCGPASESFPFPPTKHPPAHRLILSMLNVLKLVNHRLLLPFPLERPVVPGSPLDRPPFCPQRSFSLTSLHATRP